MKFRLVASLLLVAVLAALYLWLAGPDAQRPEPTSAPAPATATDQDTTPGLGRIKIF